MILNIWNDNYRICNEWWNFKFAEKLLIYELCTESNL